MSVYRLCVSNAELRPRIHLRGAGGEPPIPGDALTGRPGDWPDHAADGSIAAAKAMNIMNLGDLPIGTDVQTVNEVAVGVRDRRLALSRVP